jgi:quinoprotein glucose dehydrogenase
MPKPLSQFFSAILPVGLSLAAAVQIANAQTGTSVANGDWPVYHGDEFSQRYSPLDQINADNVGSLEIAWRLSTANFGPSTDYNNPSTPLEIDGVLYVNIASTRNVAALDATSGQVLWLWRPQEGEAV